MFATVALLWTSSPVSARWGRGRGCASYKHSRQARGAVAGGCSFSPVALCALHLPAPPHPTPTLTLRPLHPALPIIPELVASTRPTDTTAVKWTYLLRLLRLSRVFRLLQVPPAR